MSFELVDCTATLLREIAMPDIDEKDVVTTYALAIASTSPTDWSVVNAALAKRWGAKGRDRVKRDAWRRLGRAP